MALRQTDRRPSTRRRQILSERHRGCRTGWEWESGLRVFFLWASNCVCCGMWSSTVSVWTSLSLFQGTIVPICVPLVMGVVTYRIAANWIAEQGGEPGAAPTPQQYALLLKVCGSSSLFAAYETTKYLLETPKNPRPTTASTLKRAFVALISILFLSYGVGCVHRISSSTLCVENICAELPISGSIRLLVASSTRRSFPSHPT